MRARASLTDSDTRSAADEGETRARRSGRTRPLRTMAVGLTIGS